MMTMLSLFTIAIFLAPGIRGHHVHQDPVNDLLLRLRAVRDIDPGLEEIEVVPLNVAHGELCAVHEGLGQGAGTATDQSFVPGHSKPVFKPRLGKDRPPVPFRPPTVRSFPEKCMNRAGGCWCSERTEAIACNWQSDQECETVRTCGPTHPCILHEDMWCVSNTAYMEKPTLNACNRMTTPVFCTTTMYTPCRTFTPPCVRYTPPTTETCVVPTCTPCRLKDDSAQEKDAKLYDVIMKRAPEDVKTNLVDAPIQALEETLLSSRLESRPVDSCKRMTDSVYCTTTMYTPWKTFTPPCVRYTPPTTEPCVAPTCKGGKSGIYEDSVHDKDTIVYDVIMKQSLENVNTNLVEVPIQGLAA